MGVFPRLNRDPEHDEYEDFCRTKFMLHHPFGSLEDLMETDPETGISSYSYAFRRCAEIHRHPRDPLDPLDGEDESIDDDLEDADEQPDPGSQPTFAELAARTGRNDRGIDGHHADLGARPIDEMYDWHASDPIFREYGEALAEFDASLKEAPDVAQSIADPDSLQPSQRVAFDLIADHYEDVLAGLKPA